MDFATLLLFCAALTGCVALGWSVLYPLLFGFLLFCLYGRWKRVSWRALLRAAWGGIRTIQSLIVVFLLIGMLTALWRAAGTVPVIVCYAARLIRPAVFLLMAFLLNCGVSLLMGTSFGTAATMGVICATMGAAMGVSPVWTGGAVLAGAFFGDRCAPVSTSALLVCELTGTDLFSNIRAMLRASLVPTLLACAVYLAAGIALPAAGDGVDIRAIFAQEFDLHWLALLPAAAILVLSVFRVNVKAAMSVSIGAAFILCLTLQHDSLAGTLRLMLLGYRAAAPDVAAMLDGGGIVSMVNVTAIVALSSSYAGLFEATGLLDNLQRGVSKLARRATPHGAIACTALLTSIVGCNQTFAIILTHQLCRGVEPEPESMALALEDTAVVIAPLVPWSIAAAVPLSTIGAPSSGILTACFLYLLPLWHFLTHRKTHSAARL